MTGNAVAMTRFLILFFFFSPKPKGRTLKLIMDLHKLRPAHTVSHSSLRQRIHTQQSVCPSGRNKWSFIPHFYILAKNKPECQEITLITWHIFIVWHFSFLSFVVSNVNSSFYLSFLSPIVFFIASYLLLPLIISLKVCCHSQRGSQKHNHLFHRKRKEGRMIILSVQAQTNSIDGSVTLSWNPSQYVFVLCTVVKMRQCLFVTPHQRLRTSEFWAVKPKSGLFHFKQFLRRGKEKRENYLVKKNKKSWKK